MAVAPTMAAEAKLNKQAIPMIGMLAAQLLLGMAENLIGTPSDQHGTDKVLSGIILGLHVLIGLALIIRGTLALRLARKQGGKAVQLTQLGLAGVLVAFIAGVFVMATTTGDSWWSYLMTIGFLGAFLAYGALLVRSSKA